MEAETVCAYCGLAATHKCSACRNAWYCSKEHQKLDWKLHAESCKPYKVEKDRILGRHYIATRNIKIGQVILIDEQPLFAGPMLDSVPVCLGCYTALSKDIAVPCTKCGWPLCQQCNDHGLECEFTSSRRNQKVSITEFGYPHPSYQCISVIKLLSMKQANPEAYEKLLLLESHTEEINKKKSFTYEMSKRIVQFIKRFFNADDLTSDEITRAVGILQVNGHEVPLTEPPYIAIYESASLIEHNCKANCSKSFLDGGGLLVHAAVPITKGSNLSICYTDALWGTVNRRHHLRQTKFFECVCDRCKDPSEFGSMFNAIKCNKTNCSGYVLPYSFLDELSIYTCTSCKLSMSSDQVDEILIKAGMDLSSMEEDDVAGCRSFLNRYKNTLHPNHYYNTEITVKLAQMIGEESFAGLAETHLLEKMELCKNLNRLLEIITPAENRIRGLILFELHRTLDEYGKRHKDHENPVPILTESKKCLTQTYQLLQYEPQVLPEGKIATEAKRHLKQTNDVLNILYALSGMSIDDH